MKVDIRLLTTDEIKYLILDWPGRSFGPSDLARVGEMLAKSDRDIVAIRCDALSPADAQVQWTWEIPEKSERQQRTITETEELRW